MGNLSRRPRVVPAGGRARGRQPFIPLPEDNRMLDSLLADLRIAARRLRATPGFTLAGAICIALGIAANATIFSLADSLLFRPMAGVGDPVGLVEVGRSQDGSGSDTFGYPTLTALQGARTLDLAGWTFIPMAVGGDDGADGVLGLQVTDNYFEVLSVPMQLGRAFVPGESGVGAGTNAIVLGDALWRARFEADPSILGREIRVNGTTATVIGVAAEGFTGSIGVMRASAWVPFGMTAGGFADDPSLESWGSAFVLSVGRRARPVSYGRPGRARNSSGIDGWTGWRSIREALRGQGVVGERPASGLPVSHGVRAVQPLHGRS